MHTAFPAHAGEIGNFVWEDLNADGVQDRSEPGFANARVELLDCSDKKLATTFTNSSGAYSFGQLVAGNFKIRFVLPTGYAFSPSEVATTTRGKDSNPDPSTGLSKCLSMTSSQSRQGIDAGIVNGDVGGTLETSWKGMIGGVTVDGNRISYSGTPTGWLRNTVNSGLLSSLGFSGEFEARWTIDDNPANTVWIVGLGIDETSPDWTDIEFGFRSSNGLLEVRENGKWRTGGANLVKGNVLSTYVNNGTIEYRLNGSILYTSTYSGAPDFYIDTSFKEGSISLRVEIASSSRTGSATLKWTAPTKNEDGSKLADLAGYRIYWGKTTGSYSDSVTLNDPGKTSHTIGGLTAGTYEFAVTSINSAGKESRLSTPATKVIQ